MTDIKTDTRPSVAIMAKHLEVAKAVGRVADWCDRQHLSAGQVGFTGTAAFIYPDSAEQYEALTAALVELVDLAVPDAIRPPTNAIRFTVADVTSQVRVFVYPPSDYCQRVQVGTKKVTRMAPDAPTIEVEEPVYEWRCVAPGVA